MSLNTKFFVEGVIKRIHEETNISTIEEEKEEWISGVDPCQRKKTHQKIFF